MRRAVPALAAVVLAALSAATFARCGVWRDSVSIWGDVIAKQPGVAIAYVIGSGILIAAAVAMWRRNPGGSSPAV